MPQTTETLIRENIHGVFSEHDPQKRRAKVAELWAPDGVFVVPEGRYEGHAGVEKAAADLIGQFPTFVFTDHGDVQAHHEVAMVAWGYGPPGGDAVITGMDVLVMKGDKIGAVYVFHDSPKA